MKQMKFLYNVKTPDDWQRRALKMAEAEGMKPKLKKWQSAGIVAVTAAAVIGMTVVPMLYGIKDNNAVVDNTSYKVREQPEAEKEKEEESEEEKRYKAVQKMKDMYGYVESVTVLECKKSEDTDTIMLVGARESYQLGNFLFGTLVMSANDVLTGNAELPKFGDKVVLGFETLHGEEWLDARFNVDLDGRNYQAVQNQGTMYCKGYTDLGKWDDEFFDGILCSAQAAAKVTEDTFNDKVKDYVRGSYSNITHIKPKIKGGIKRSGEDTGLETHMMTTIFDEDFISGGVVSQLYVMRIEKTDGGKLSAVSTFDSLKKTCSLEIDGRKGSLKTKCDTDIDILNVRMVEDAVNENTAYLLINAVDKERTGDIRGNLKIDIVLDEVKEQEKVTPHEPVCIKTQHTEAEDSAYDFSVVPSEDVEVWHSTADGLKGTQFVYTFDLSTKDGANINGFMAGGKNYVIDVQKGYEMTAMITENISGGKIRLKILLMQEEMTDVPNDGVVISFRKDGDNTSSCSVKFSNEESENEEGITMIGLESY